MEMHFEELLDRITQFMQGEARTETVVGEPFQLGEFSCIPVVRLGLGFGTGGGEGDSPKEGQGSGGGAGAGLGIEPIGFLVSRGDSINFINTRNPSTLGKAFEQVPELLSKYLKHQREVQTQPVVAE